MKIRFDFVTNSSSSSFVIYRISDFDLVRYVKELMAGGKINDSLQSPDSETILGYEEGEKLKADRDLTVTRQIGQMSSAPYNMQVFRAEETGRYSEKALREDCAKMLERSIVLDAVKTFFDLSEGDMKKLRFLVNEAIYNDNVSCGVFVDELDGFRGYLGQLYSLSELKALQPQKPKSPDPKPNSKRIAGAPAKEQ